MKEYLIPEPITCLRYPLGTCMTVFLPWSASNLGLYEQQAEFGETIDHPAYTSITTERVLYEVRGKAEDTSINRALPDGITRKALRIIERTMEELVEYRVNNRSLAIEIVFDYYRFYEEIWLATGFGELVYEYYSGYMSSKIISSCNY